MILIFNFYQISITLLVYLNTFNDNQNRNMKTFIFKTKKIFLNGGTNNNRRKVK